MVGKEVGEEETVFWFCIVIMVFGATESMDFFLVSGASEQVKEREKVKKNCENFQTL